MPDFQPTFRQQQFDRAVRRYDEVGYGGALGGGKTVCVGCWFPINQSVLYPGNLGVVFRDTLINLRDSTMAEFKRFVARYYPDLPITWRMSPSIECEIECGNGIKSTILWRETSDAGKMLSANLGWVAIDEATQTSHDFYLTISGRIGRHVLPDGSHAPAKLVWASNPGPGWCKTLFPVGPKPSARAEILSNGAMWTRAFVPALHSDNPHLPVDYIPRLRAKYPDIWVRRWLQGDWDAFEGQVFDEFDESRHCVLYVLDPERTLGWLHILAHDWGFTNPAAALMCSIDPDGHWFFWRGHYQAGWTPQQHAPAIKAMMRELTVEAQVIDYAAVDQLTGTSLQAIYNEMGFEFQGCTKRKNGPTGSIMLFKQLLKEGRVHICPDCPDFVTEIKNARWKPLSAVQADLKSKLEEMVDKDDHALDACFMALEWWRESGKTLKPVADQHFRAVQQYAKEQERSNVITRRKPDGSWKPLKGTGKGLLKI